MHVVTWPEAGRKAYRLCATVLDPQLNPVGDMNAITLPRQHFRFDVASLANGEFAVAWNEKNLVQIQSYDVNGLCRKNTAVGKTSKPGGQIELAVFPTGEIAIGCTDFLSLQTESGLLLCAVSPEAWCATMICLQNGSLVRAEMIAKNPSYLSDLPRYGLSGFVIDRSGLVTNKFYLHVPTTIVGGVCSHPDHLAISALSDGGFVIIWTQLGHTFGNSIQGQIFDCEGVALGKTFAVAAATLKSSVNEPTVISTEDGGFLVAWSENDESAQTHRIQIFDNGGIGRGAAYAPNASTTEDRGTIKFCRLSTGHIITYWLENDGIKTFNVNFEGI